ncbi:hypothetical protein NN3_46470 [Nocardia neocaledoniensis NBRC 108232]|uniref:Uncharacterized protein n=1 Tax=Nocardia neocaledoniensis TaxID=236511 RepID=A0A317NAR1_9NOCA|nr:hypothetical protein DFR69_109232 [Nocardia neocaledoniensis]GEM33640.1 hypothetical protein NN3_46470 [Nocardia neocaledoniensis NBRC 108232]
MWQTDGFEVEDWRWRWAVAGLALGGITVTVTAISPLYSIALATAVMLAGLAISHVGEFRPSGARLVSLGFGMLVPTAAAAAMLGISSL